MLSQKVLNEADILSIEAEKNNLVVSALPATPLAALISAMPISGIVDDNVVDSVGSASKQETPMGDTEHGDAMVEMTNLAVEAIRKQHKLAREVVNPTFTEIAAHVQKHSTIDKAGSLRPSITVNRLHAIFDDVMLMDMVAKYEKTPASTSNGCGGILGHLTANDVEGRLKTGIKRLDVMLEKIASESPGLTYRVFKDHILKSKGNPYNTEEPYDVNIGKLFTYVLLVNLSNNIPDGVNLELVQYRATLTSCMAEAGRQLFGINRVRDMQIRQKVLVTKPLSQYDNVIHVNGPVYDQYIAEGGTPESIIGGFLKGLPILRYNEYLEDAHNGMGAVKINELAITAKLKADKAGNVTEAFVSKVNELKKDGLPEGVIALDRAVTRKWLEQNPFTDTMDIEDWVLKATCSILFPRIPAYELLNNMRELKKANPDLTTREAATLVTIDLVSNWLVAQLVVDKA